MSEKISNQEHHSENHDDNDLNATDETVYNTVKKEDRKLKVHDEEEMEEFNSWNKKYNFIAKQIRKNAIEQEKRELENLKKSPITKYKYFEGSKEDRILQLDEEKKLLEEMENLAKTKDKKKPKKIPQKSAAESSKEPSNSAGTTGLDEEKEDPEFRKMRKEYHETSKEMRRKSLHIEKNELKKNQQKDKLDYVPGSPKDRLKTVGGEVSGLEKIQRLKIEKEKKEKKNKDHK